MGDRKLAEFKWTKTKSDAALALAQGYSVREVSEMVPASERTLWRWKAEPEFDEEVDRLSLMVDIAGRAERLRIARRVVRQKVDEEGYVLTEKDLLDWLKFAQSETDGVKLDLLSLLEAGKE